MTGGVAAATCSVERSQDIHRRIKRVFDAFDIQSNQTCNVREVGTIIRSLNIYPTEEQLKIWIQEMGDCGSDNAITFARFSAVISGVITSNLYVRDNDEKLFQAFQVLDKEKRGFLTPDELRGFLTTQGDVFSPEEMQEMLITCTDPTENKIYYDDYVELTR